ncbi:MAG: YkgJ family cysteine cluster protein [Sphingomonas sp.]|uniref:YkgJ family cysteine cluster protein n=1 Tax=Sphingomonas sp. TaxID=28214 RepID=UPI00121FC214|nr:YkgJ family cysteine cluster protein [Sphingomonas sp.]THD38243.1 MAG: YkgJ family cysteine cluster protein [Sphingomonas sp.]
MPASLSFEEEVFGPLVPGRECGGCTACCFEITIDDPKLAKPPRETCVHCTANGCSIYAARPQDCRTWYCLWRRVADLPDHLSPDKSGLLTSVVENPAAENPFARLYIIVQWLDGRPIAKSDAADELLAAMRRYALPVWVGSGDRMALHFPRQEIALHLMHGTPAPAAIAREVEAWRRRLPRRSAPPV